MRSHPSSFRGFTLVETLIVLAVVIAVVSVVAALAVSARSQTDTNALLQMITTVQTNIRGHYSNRQDYTGLNTHEAVSLGVLPRGLASLSGATYIARHPLGGAFGVGPSAYVNSVTSSPSSGFYMKAVGLSREACILVLVATGPNFQGIVVDTSAVDVATDNNQSAAFTPRYVTARGTQVSATQAQTWCSSPTSNSVRWETS